MKFRIVEKFSRLDEDTGENFRKNIIDTVIKASDKTRQSANDYAATYNRLGKVSDDDSRTVRIALNNNNRHLYDQLTDKQLELLMSCFNKATNMLDYVQKQGRISEIEKEIERLEKIAYRAAHYGDNESGDWETVDECERKINRLEAELKRLKESRLEESYDKSLLADDFSSEANDAAIKALFANESLKEDINDNKRKEFVKVGKYSIIEDEYGYGVDDGYNVNRFYVDDKMIPKFDYLPNKSVKEKIYSLIKKGNIKPRSKKEEPLKESYQKPLQELADDLQDYLHDNKLYARPIIDENEKSISFEIEDGDWKHEHLRLKLLANEFFADEKMKYDYDEEVTEESDGDWYSAIHTFSNIRPMEKGETRRSIYREEKKSIKEDVYTDNGYKNREDYLTSLADEYGLDKQTVFDVANMLGRNEDFDALITELEDLMWEKINYSDDDDYEEDEEETYTDGDIVKFKFISPRGNIEEGYTTEYDIDKAIDMGTKYVWFAYNKDDITNGRVTTGWTIPVDSIMVVSENAASEKLIDYSFNNTKNESLKEEAQRQMFDITYVVNGNQKKETVVATAEDEAKTTIKNRYKPTDVINFTASIKKPYNPNALPKNESCEKLNETAYGADELWNYLNNTEYAYNHLHNIVQRCIEKKCSRKVIEASVRKAIYQMKDDFGRIPTTQAERAELAKNFVEDELSGSNYGESLKESILREWEEWDDRIDDDEEKLDFIDDDYSDDYCEICGTELKESDEGYKYCPQCKKYIKQQEEEEEIENTKD